MNGAETLKAIERELAAGKTVYISTAYQSTPVSAKTAEKFRAAGFELFRVDSSDSLYMRRGKGWDCIDFCRFTVAQSP